MATSPGDQIHHVGNQPMLVRFLLQPQEARNVSFHGCMRSLCGNTRRGKPYDKSTNCKTSSSPDGVDNGSAGLCSLSIAFPSSFNCGRIGFGQANGGVGFGSGPKPRMPASLQNLPVSLGVWPGLSALHETSWLLMASASVSRWPGTSPSCAPLRLLARSLRRELGLRQ